jgi:hypothetical protein
MLIAFNNDKNLKEKEGNMAKLIINKKAYSFFIMMLVLFLPALGFCGTYWVSPLGTASWVGCSGATPLSGTAACSLTTATANAQAGDIVYIRAVDGVYKFSAQYSQNFSPKNNGNLGNYIVFKNYGLETPELQGTYGVRMWGLSIDGKSYLQIDGIIFTDFSDYAIDAASHHIEIKNCTFRNITSPYRGGSFYIVPQCLGGTAGNCPNHDIWIHNNTFHKLAAGGGCDGSSISEGGDAVRIGYVQTTYNSNTLEDYNITIENNYFAYGGHALFDSYGVRIVFKNNILHNEPWYPADNGACSVIWPANGYTNSAYNGLYGHRVFQMTDTFNNANKNNFVEGNRFGYGSVNPNNDGADSVDFAVSGSIFRYNFVFGAMNDGFMFKYGNYATYGWQASGGNNDRVYNNTIYKNGYGYPFYNTCTYSTCPEPEYGIRWYAAVGEIGNVVKNNIVYGNRSAVEKGGVDIQANPNSTIANNYITPNGDPKFVNPDLSNPTSPTLPDLSLQSTSTAIDKGTYLAVAVAAGAGSTKLVVNDAMYFQDGSWGADMAKGVSHFPDWIAVGTVSNIAQISAIDYATNTITLATPITWAANAPVWVYKKSDGTQVLYGAAPDMGAFEYGLGIYPPPNFKTVIK